MKLTTEIVCSDNLKLRLLTKQDAMPIFEAISNQRIYLGKWFAQHNEPIKLEKIKASIEKFTEPQDSPNDIIYIIEYESDFAGFIGLKCIDWYNNKAELECWVQEKYQHLTIMLEAGSRFLEYIFRKVNLNRLEVKTTQDNIKLRDFTRRLGFSQEGIEKQGLKVADNKYLNLTIHSMLHNEYHTKLMFYRRGTKLRNDL